jgi:chromosomal replication initiation ATPase DnaA
MTTEQEQAVKILVADFEKALRMKIDEATKEALKMDTNRIRFNLYAVYIADYFGVKKERMLSNATRKDNYKNGRYILWWLLRNGDSGIKWSLERIGIESGGFDHATVRHGVYWVHDMDYKDIELQRDVVMISSGLGYKVIKKGKLYVTETIEAA